MGISLSKLFLSALNLTLIGLGLPLTWGAVWASLALRMVRACPCPGVVGESSIAPLSTKHKTEQKNAQGLPLSSHDSSGRFSRAT